MARTTAGNGHNKTPRPLPSSGASGSRHASSSSRDGDVRSPSPSGSDAESQYDAEVDTWDGLVTADGVEITVYIWPEPAFGAETGIPQQTRKQLSQFVVDLGGSVAAKKIDADVIIIPGEYSASRTRQLGELWGPKGKLVRKPDWLARMAAQYRTLKVPAPVEASQRIARSSAKKFDPSDYIKLAAYLAYVTPGENDGGRQGNVIYQNLIDNTHLSMYAWAKGYTAGQLRSRYKAYRAAMDQHIQAIVNQNPELLRGHLRRAAPEEEDIDDFIPSQRTLAVPSSQTSGWAGGTNGSSASQSRPKKRAVDYNEEVEDRPPSPTAVQRAPSISLDISHEGDPPLRDNRGASGSKLYPQTHRGTHRFPPEKSTRRFSRIAPFQSTQLTGTTLFDASPRDVRTLSPDPQPTSFQVPRVSPVHPEISPNVRDVEMEEHAHPDEWRDAEEQPELQEQAAFVPLSQLPADARGTDAGNAADPELTTENGAVHTIQLRGRTVAVPMARETKRSKRGHYRQPATGYDLPEPSPPDMGTEPTSLGGRKRQKRPAPQTVFEEESEVVRPRSPTLPDASKAEEHADIDFEVATPPPQPSFIGAEEPYPYKTPLPKSMLGTRPSSQRFPSLPLPPPRPSLRSLRMQTTPPAPDPDPDPDSESAFQERRERLLSSGVLEASIHAPRTPASSTYNGRTPRRSSGIASSAPSSSVRLANRSHERRRSSLAREFPEVPREDEAFLRRKAHEYGFTTQEAVQFYEDAKRSLAETEKTMKNLTTAADIFLERMEMKVTEPVTEEEQDISFQASDHEATMDGISFAVPMPRYYPPRKSAARAYLEATLDRSPSR